MPDFRYTGTFQINSNDPATPREIGLQAVQSTFLAPVSFVSYEGSATIHGITELGNVSDPPRKYQNLVPDNGGFLRQDDGVGANLSPLHYSMLNRTSVNDSDVKYQQMALQQKTGNKGNNFTFPTYTDIPALSPWFTGEAWNSIGGFGADSMEDVAAPGLVSFGWEDGTNWFKLPFTKDKRYKILTPAGFDRDVNEEDGDAVEPSSPVITFYSRSIGSTTDSNGRFNILISAQRGMGAHDDGWNIVVRWQMSQPPVGSGPAAQVWIQGRRGKQPLTADDTANFLGSLVAGPGSGSVFKYRRFGLPSDTSFRLFGRVVGEANEYQFPQDWASEEARITDEELETADYDNYFYLDRDVPVAGFLRNQQYREVLVNEDPLPDAVIAEVGTIVANNEWARTVAVSGGVAPESHDPIDFDGEIIRASFTMPNLTPLQVYTVKLTYEQRLIGVTNTTFLEESIDVYPGLATEKLVEIDVIAPEGFERRLYATSVTGVVPQPADPDGVDRINSLLWEGEALNEGASFTPAETTAISGFLDGLASKPYKNNLKYVLPFMGSDLASSLFPCWDLNGWGPPTNSNFVDGDCSTAGGLQGNGSTKYLTMPFRHYDLQGVLDKSGEGVYFNQLNYGGDGGQWIGANWEAGNTQIFGLRIGDYRALFYHGSTGESVGNAITEPAEGANYFGVAFSDTSRKIYKDGVLQDTNTNAVNSSGASANDCVLFADTLSGIRENASSVFVAYYTDGSAVWTDANILDLHNLIQTHLIDAVGRSVSTVNPDVATWKTRVAANSGTLSVNSETYAQDLLDDLRAWDGYHKLRYTAAWLGADIPAFLVPVYDPALAGPMVNTGFVLADFGEATGVQGAGLVPGSKIITVPRTASELGATNNGGLGWRELDHDFPNQSSQSPVGFQHAGSGYAFSLRLNSTSEGFRWGLTGNQAVTAVGATNAHYYGQRKSATDRKLYRDGSQIASNTTSDSAANSNATDFGNVGLHDLAGPTNYYWAGRSGFMYMTNGELTPAEITSLHTIIEDFITATGR